MGAVLTGLSLIPAAGCSSLAARGQNSEGVRLFQQARYQEALEQFHAATFADKNNPDGYYNLASTYHRLGLASRRQSDLDQSEKYYHMCLDKDENHRDCYRGLAVLLAEQGRSEDAFRLVEGWVDARPDAADAKIELARLYDEFGDQATAKERLTEALAVDPNNARARAALGKIQEEMGAHAQALKNYQASLRLDHFQPQVAARVASLQSSSSPPGVSITLPDSATRMAEKESISLK